MKKLYSQALVLGLILFATSQLSFAQEVGSPALDFTVKTLDGDTFTLSEQKGNVVFVFLFGFSCSHCQDNAPNTQTSIYDVFKDNPNFKAIAIDVWDGSDASVTGFRSRTGLTYPIGTKGRSIMDDYVTTYDRILIIDADGTLRYKAADEATSTVVAEAADTVRKYLGEISGVEEAFENKLSLNVYPNPATNLISIATGSAGLGNKSVSITDLRGRTVHHITNPAEANGLIRLDVSDYPGGVYLVRFREAEMESLTRLIITR